MIKFIKDSLAPKFGVLTLGVMALLSLFLIITSKEVYLLILQEFEKYVDFKSAMNFVDITISLAAFLFLLLGMILSFCIFYSVIKWPFKKVDKLFLQLAGLLILFHALLVFVSSTRFYEGDNNLFGTIFVLYGLSIFITMLLKLGSREDVLYYEYSYKKINIWTVYSLSVIGLITLQIIFDWRWVEALVLIVGVVDGVDRFLLQRSNHIND